MKVISAVGKPSISERRASCGQTECDNRDNEVTSNRLYKQSRAVKSVQELVRIDLNWSRAAMLSAFRAQPIYELKQQDKSKIESVLAYGMHSIYPFTQCCTDEIAQATDSS